jgi:hypothetical protein
MENLYEKRKFPNKDVSKLWCPTTERALEIMTVAQLVSPSHIIIYTGTNDLCVQQEGVTTSHRSLSDRKGLHHLPLRDYSNIYPAPEERFSSCHHPEGKCQPLSGQCAKAQRQTFH